MAICAEAKVEQRWANVHKYCICIDACLFYICILSLHVLFVLPVCMFVYHRYGDFLWRFGPSHLPPEEVLRLSASGIEQKRPSPAAAAATEDVDGLALASALGPQTLSILLPHT